ncbi:hypothetical protein V495_02785 [Pseudogymnoascus sp. VKM F-4514 (FW-929)]|nr:hypothetical protein V495_02785 [Pseudogymnoascus sp. VKM F-4514 (FW-929)]KFY59471.1 hypothetical protein V497_04258 [Pseudogymnoascus sp. VKM F-4516 (FW-969)]
MGTQAGQNEATNMFVTRREIRATARVRKWEIHWLISAKGTCYSMLPSQTTKTEEAAHSVMDTGHCHRPLSHRGRMADVRGEDEGYGVSEAPEGQ